MGQLTSRGLSPDEDTRDYVEDTGRDQWVLYHEVDSSVVHSHCRQRTPSGDTVFLPSFDREIS